MVSCSQDKERDPTERAKKISLVMVRSANKERIMYADKE
jgi:hypothetical protein